MERSWLLLHGTPLTPAIWEGVRPYLEHGQSVLAPRLPVPAGPDGAQRRIADDLVSGLIDAAPRGGTFDLVGHSFGGQVALEVALLAPHRIASLTILCSRAAPFPAFEDLARSVRSGAVPDPHAAVARWFTGEEYQARGPLVVYSEKCLEDADRTVWADELDAIATYDRMQVLPQLQMPVHLIAAELDGVGSPDHMRQMAAGIPGSALTEIPAAAHMSPFGDPGRLAHLLDQHR